MTLLPSPESGTAEFNDVFVVNTNALISAFAKAEDPKCALHVFDWVVQQGLMPDLKS